MKEPSTPASRIPELDGIRGLAILSVLYWHYFASQAHPDASATVNILERAGRLSWAGVDLFFVLSGFLIGGILLRNRKAPNLLRVFYTRRVLRIFPIYFAWLIAFFIVRSLIGDQNRFLWLFGFPLPTWSYLTFTQNFVAAAHRFFGAHWLAPTWSLAVEEQFYLVLPFLVLWLRPRQLVAFSVLLIAAAPFIRYALLLQGNVMGAMVLLQAKWDSLFLGVIGACVLQGGIPTALRPVHQRLLHGVLASLLLFIAALIAWPQLMSLWMAALLPTFFGLLSLSLIGFALFSPWRRLLANRWLAGLGAISYGVYIIHEGVYGLLYSASHGAVTRIGEPTTSSWLDLGTVLASLVITVVLATLSFRAFESRAIGLGRKLRYIAADVRGPMRDSDQEVVAGSRAKPQAPS